MDSTPLLLRGLHATLHQKEQKYETVVISDGLFLLALGRNGGIFDETQRLLSHSRDPPNNVALAVENPLCNKFEEGVAPKVEHEEACTEYIRYFVDQLKEKTEETRHHRNCVPNTHTWLPLYLLLTLSIYQSPRLVATH